MLAAPKDATTGAAIASLDHGKAVIVGGVVSGAAAPTRIIDLTCSDAMQCIPSTADGALVDTLATRTQAFSVTNGVIVVGDSPNGETLAFDVSLASGASGTATPLALREPRRGATAIPTPNGMLAILGGEL
jgi:hypothetical protein